MCLAVPGKVVEWLDRDPLFAAAWVEFGGVRRRVSMACAPEAVLGDYVLVHAGVAITRVDAEEADRMRALLVECLEEPSWEEDPASDLDEAGPAEES